MAWYSVKAQGHIYLLPVPVSDGFHHNAIHAGIKKHVICVLVGEENMDDCGLLLSIKRRKIM
jgi:hypothetical protein